MIKRLRQHYQTKAEFDALLVAITHIRKTHGVLNICVKPTGYSWLGVRTAAFSLFPHNTVEIPQYYSNQLLSKSQLSALGDHIGQLGFEQLIYNGYNTYFSHISTRALRVNPSLRISWIHHGFPAELTEATIIGIFGEAINDYKNGLIHRVGIVKKNWELLLKPLYDIPAFFLLNRVTVEERPYQEKKLRIGVLVNNSFRKNQITQIMAAATIPSATVVVNHASHFRRLFPDTVFDVVGDLSHTAFLNVLNSCTVNSHVTFSESFGGQVFAESLAMGIPCLTSPSHGWLDDNPTLFEALTVTRIDDAWAINQKLIEIIERRKELYPLCIAHTHTMNQRADFLLNQFLS